MATVSAADPAAKLNDDDVAAINRLGAVYQRLKKELGRVIIGQEETIERLTICLFARGHALLMGVPGLAKTLLVSKLAETVSLKFNRIQFTPDLMPMDITGTDILQETADGRREFHFVPGPVFANIVLADEINRAPPKTQAAMLEAMQEHKVTVVGKTSHLDPPFFVLATQNPVEQEGTYPLPEAQQDRFMFKVFVRYPTFQEEFEIARRTTGLPAEDAQPVLSAADIIGLQQAVRGVPVSDHLVRYALALVRQTRAGEKGTPDFVSDQLSWGAGPRAVQFLIIGAKARALLQGRSHVAVEDIQALASPVLRHRIVVGFAAESEGVTPDGIIQRIIETTPAREDELTRDPRFQTIFAS